MEKFLCNEKLHVKPAKAQYYDSTRVCERLTRTHWYEDGWVQRWHQKMTKVSYSFNQLSQTLANAYSFYPNSLIITLFCTFTTELDQKSILLWICHWCGIIGKYTWVGF